MGLTFSTQRALTHKRRKDRMLRQGIPRFAFGLEAQGPPAGRRMEWKINNVLGGSAPAALRNVGHKISFRSQMIWAGTDYPDGVLFDIGQSSAGLAVTFLNGQIRFNTFDGGAGNIMSLTGDLDDFIPSRGVVDWVVSIDQDPAGDGSLPQQGRVWLNNQLVLSGEGDGAQTVWDTGSQLWGYGQSSGNTIAGVLSNAAFTGYGGSVPEPMEVFIGHPLPAPFYT